MADGQQNQPNILVIWGDDIGITNLSAYSNGLMGYHTPNIDRIAQEGMRFTDCYGEQSCTAGPGFTHQRSEVERYAKSGNFKASLALRNVPVSKPRRVVVGRAPLPERPDA